MPNNPNDINEVIRLKNLCSEYRELAESLINLYYTNHDTYCQDLDLVAQEIEYRRLFYKLSPQEGSYPCEACQEPVTKKNTCSSCLYTNYARDSMHVYGIDPIEQYSKSLEESSD